MKSAAASCAINVVERIHVMAHVFEECAPHFGGSLIAVRGSASAAGAVADTNGAATAIVTKRSILAGEGAGWRTRNRPEDVTRKGNLPERADWFYCDR
ncbi:hypothetical protein HQ394_18145 [Defluviicoccus vanus]|uniref:Uncharacterized protein n=1 Tax=Defluviicoccus vanus TaxID=111831 RepID=A0A7H1N598_9PROT|nr:hypothetical protein HQ394_18145 [Defluviicoccus vanus]